MTKKINRARQQSDIHTGRENVEWSSNSPQEQICSKAMKLDEQELEQLKTARAP